MAGGSKGRKGGGGSGGGGTKAKRSQPKNTRTGIGGTSSKREGGRPTFDVKAAGSMIRQSVRKQAGVKRTGTKG